MLGFTQMPLPKFKQRHPNRADGLLRYLVAINDNIILSSDLSIILLRENMVINICKVNSHTASGIKLFVPGVYCYPKCSSSKQ